MHHRVLWLANDYNELLGELGQNSYESIKTKSLFDRLFWALGEKNKRPGTRLSSESFSRLVVLPGFGAINPSLIFPLNPNGQTSSSREKPVSGFYTEEQIVSSTARQKPPSFILNACVVLIINKQFKNIVGTNEF